MSKKSIIHGAIILTSANIITRILGFIYRIYMSNVIGAEGMGLYQLIVPIYMLIWSMSSSGFSTTISKLTAQENAKHEQGNIHRILKQSVLTSVLISVVLSILLFLFSEKIGVEILKDGRTILSLKILSTCFPFMAAGSCIRGYFFGLQKSSVPAISQVFEQAVRMAAIYFLASILIPRGLEYASAAAVIGMCLGEILSFFYVYFSYRSFKENYFYDKKPSLNAVKVYAMIMAIAIPLTANRVTGSFLCTLENILIPLKLQGSGMTSTEALSTYGRLNGMAMPLLMFPSSLLTSLSITIVPAVSEAKAIKNTKSISNTVTKTMLFTSITGIGASGLFITFSNEIAMAIYNEAETGHLLYLLGFICPFLYYQVTLSGILNGLGEQLFIFRNSLLSSAINLMFIYFLIPIYGINAYIIGSLVSLIVVSILDINRVKLRTGLKLKISDWIIKPALSITFCCLIIKIIYKYIPEMSNNMVSFIISALLLGILYLIMLIITGCITTKELISIIKNV